MIARILFWSLFDSKTTLEELRANLPSLPEGDVWLTNEATDRFGLISLSEELPDLEGIRDLIGRDPEVFEEFDVEPR